MRPNQLVSIYLNEQPTVTSGGGGGITGSPLVAETVFANGLATAAVTVGRGFPIAGAGVWFGTGCSSDSLESIAYGLDCICSGGGKFNFAGGNASTVASNQTGNIAFGRSATVFKSTNDIEGAMAFGSSSSAQESFGMAFGANAIVAELASNGCAFGSSAAVFSRNGVAVGSGASIPAFAEDSVAFGAQAQANALEAISIGFQTTGIGIQLGARATATDASAMAFGTDSVAVSSGLAFGFQAKAGNNCVVFGKDADSSSQDGNVLVGNGTLATDQDAVVVGTSASCGSRYGSVVGQTAIIQGGCDLSTAVGQAAEITSLCQKSTVVGALARTVEQQQNCLVLGCDAVAGPWNAVSSCPFAITVDGSCVPGIIGTAETGTLRISINNVCYHIKLYAPI